MDKKIKKVILTGGHHNSVLAIIDYINELSVSGRPFKTQFYWIGRKFVPNTNEESPEYVDVTTRGIPFYNLNAGKLFRTKNILYFGQVIKNLFLIPVGIIQAFVILNKIKPDLIVSFGGYLGLPPVVSGWLLRKKIIIVEQTSTMGLSNKIIAVFADIICVSWPVEIYDFNQKQRVKAVHTGLPLRKAILTTNQFEPDEYKNFSKNLPIIYITGGKLGSIYINHMIYEIIGEISNHMNIIWQCGQSVSRNYDGDYSYDVLNKKVKGLNAKLQNRIVLKKYIFDEGEMSYIYGECDLVISRGGAHTVYELATKSKKAIIIPIPWSSGNEQYKNAKILADLGIAKILEQEDTDSKKLKEEIYKSLSAKVVKVPDDAIPLDGTKNVANEIFRILKN